MTKPVKLFDIRGNDWMRGISIVTSAQIGGIFQQASNFDPFLLPGYMRPSMVASDFTVAAIDKEIYYFVPIDVGGGAQLYAFAGQTSSELYEITALSGAVTDRSAQITAGAARGAIAHKGYFVYALENSVRSRAIPVTGGADAAVVASIASGQHPFVVGADLNLYFPNGKSIGKIIDPSTTTGNTDNAFSLETGMTIRDLRNDGRNLVFVADNQPSTSGGLGVAGCVVAFWDYTSPNLRQRWDFQDSRVYAVEIMDDGIYVFGQDALYRCSIDSPPVPILSFRSPSSITGYPIYPGAVMKRGNVMYWGDGQSGKIFAYGSLVVGQRKIFYQPYNLASGNTTAISGTSTTFYAGTSTPKLYETKIGTGTRDTATLVLAGVVLDRPYRFSFAKVVSKNELASGQSITVKIYGHGITKLITNTVTFSFAADGTKQSKIITRSANGSGDVNEFNEISQVEVTANLATVQSVEIWGEPVEITSQNT